MADDRPVPLDEYPVHQVPLSMKHVATGDRNAYDRCIFHVLDHEGRALLILGLGVYPNVGVIDAYATLRTGDTLHAVRASDALGDDRMRLAVGPCASRSRNPCADSVCAVRTTPSRTTSLGPQSSPRSGNPTTSSTAATGSPSKGAGSSRRAGWRA